MNPSQIDHDRLFKELLEAFFAEFMELFFPDAYQAIDFTHLKFLQQEVFTDVTAGGRYEADIIVETSLKTEPGLILVHVEPQAYVQKDFNERMFIYFSRFYEKYRRKILPIAVFSYDQERDEPDTFNQCFSFLDVLLFHFYKLELKKLSWRDYVHRDNPVAAALLSKMGFSEEEKVQVKLEFLRLLTRLKLDPARMELITGFFEFCFKLNSQEEEQLFQELGRINQKEADLIMQITTSWHEKGKIEGKAEGKIEGKIEAVCKFMARKFNADTCEIKKDIQRVASPELLDSLMEELFAASTLEEAQSIIRKIVGKSLQ